MRGLSVLEVSCDKEMLNLEYIYSYLKESYWSKNIPKSLFLKSVENSLCFGAYLNDEQMGFARVVSDFSTFAYLCDVFIDDQFKGRGYSKKLLLEVMKHPELQGLRRFCLGTKDAQGLYEKFGFSHIRHPENWMEINRKGLYIDGAL